MEFWRKIPGFRSGKRWKMALAVLGYIFIILIASTVIIVSSYHNDSPVTNTIKPAAEPSSKALIVYYSLNSKRNDGGYSNMYDGGYSEQTAYAIADGLVSKNWEVTLLRVEPADGNVLNMLYTTVGYTFGQNWEVGIKDVSLDVSGYDLVIIGSPTWNYGPVAAINSYISQSQNLEGKNVTLFTTAGGDASPTIQKMQIKVNKRGANVTDTLILLSSQKAEAGKLAEEFGRKLGS